VGFGASEASPSQSLPAFWAFSEALSVSSATMSTISRSLTPSPAGAVVPELWLSTGAAVATVVLAGVGTRFLGRRPLVN